ncbi:MAG TPA: dihydrolipoyllysine-residue acetyltransferase [Anaeromyxobacteraceae bacterium]|jgi:pyruvate dehydrogenase E2 component (dihydrolipoamide acetyltransferase)
MSAFEVRVPGIGDFKDVGVIDVLVKPGDRVKADDSLITLESDKATMDVPSPAGGTVVEVMVKVGDRVREGTVILKLEEAAAASAPLPLTPALSPAPAGERETALRTPTEVPTAARRASPLPRAGGGEGQGEARAHASPSVRKAARELGVDLARVPGSGPRGRILQQDVVGFVKQAMSGAAPAGGIAGLDLLPWPRVDFARFGPVEGRPLSRIRKISAANLARNWVMIPHVTQHEEADVTDLEAFRQELNAERKEGEARVTLLAFLVKACVAALRRFPELNASLDGESLVLKRHYHIGFAADTPHGLVVPVLRDADRKGIGEIAAELAALAARAREGKLAPADLQGGTFTISSLGGIGGTAFTPIVNAPEVAILGVSRASTKPVWDGKAFVPRLLLPLSLSYDHRVVDGAAGARFVTHLAALLRDLRRTIL